MYAPLHRVGVIYGWRKTGNLLDVVKSHGCLKAANPKSKEVPMATYIVLGQFTDQGIRDVQDTSKRANKAKELAKKFGVSVRDLYWSLGRYDLAMILDAPDDETMTALGLSFGKLGNVRTETLRAFSQAEIDQILKRVM
jgi:uncharacterized protein with GYD domain